MSEGVKHENAHEREADQIENTVHDVTLATRLRPMCAPRGPRLVFGPCRQAVARAAKFTRSVSLVSNAARPLALLSCPLSDVMGTPVFRTEPALAAHQPDNTGRCGRGILRRRRAATKPAPLAVTASF